MRGAADARPIGPSDAADANTNIALDDDDLLDKFKGWWQADRDHSGDWREQAEEEFAFVAGDQWTDDDRASLEEQMRPVVTFNRVEPMVNIVCGLESGNRQETRFIPRELGDVGVNDLLTEAAKWVRDECDAEDEESDAFRDSVICGMGWIDTDLEYDVDPMGMVAINRLDPLEMYWDCAARKANLADARRVWRVREVPLSEAQDEYPDFDDDDLNAGWADILPSTKPVDETEASFYRTNQTGNDDHTRDKVRLVEVQWWERETSWLVLDPFTGQQTRLKDDEYTVLQDRMRQISAVVPMPPMKSVKQKVRVYRRAVIGSKILEIKPGPAKGGFSWKCITGLRDRNNGYWYGIVHAMLDPQRWANKFFSQTMHILNSGAKGGPMVEADAFEDIREAEKDWADNSRFVVTTPGALQNGKVQARPVAPMPQALTELLPLSISAIRDCSGINLELLGMVERDQPGVLEHQRKQAGMTVLAGLFNSLRRYRKEQGRLLLWYITEFLSDGRLIRIGGPSAAKYVPLIHQPGLAEYDVIVDDTPTSPNMKERVWATLMQAMPFLSRLPIPPQIYMELFKYSPLPESVLTKVEELAKQEEQNKKPDPLEIMAKAKAMESQARVQLIGAQSQKAQADAAIAGQKLQVEGIKAQTDAQQQILDIEHIRAQIENLRASALANMAKAGAVQSDAEINRQLAQLDILSRLVDAHHDQQRIDNERDGQMQQQQMQRMRSVVRTPGVSAG